MRTRFDALPLRRKLIALVLGVNIVSLLSAVIGFVGFDFVRFRAAAVDETRALAEIIAGNTAAAIVFGDVDAAHDILVSMHVRPVIRAACVYEPDGTVFASYVASSDARCPQYPADRQTLRTVSSVVAINHDGRKVGTVLVERALSDQRGRIAAAAAAGALMLALAGGIALGLAKSLQRRISGPIVELARAARGFGGGATYALPQISAPPDETGELVRAFGDMVRRVGETTTELRAEIERRREMQAERETLLLREREASRLKDEFLAAVSHELRTPLNAILGWTQILRKTTPSPDTLARALSRVERNARAQSRLIEDLLDISRIITGKLTLSLVPLDLRAAIGSAIEVVEPVRTAKDIRIDVALPPGPCIVQADHDRLRQVLWNLLSNAVKFTPASGLVSVSLTHAAGVFRIDVADSGIGIAPEFLPHVFERFRQADGSVTREQGGLGLGLAIAKELIDLHGGTVAAASDGPGKGATFSITLRELGGFVTEGDEGTRPETEQRLDGLDVMVVDDNADARDIATSALEAAGALARALPSGAAALAEWKRVPARFLLCDLAMPHMDGFELLKAIRALDLAAGRDPIPAIAVTAYASAETRARCLRAGFVGHVAKPFNTTALIEAVAAAVDRTPGTVW